MYLIRVIFACLPVLLLAQFSEVQNGYQVGAHWPAFSTRLTPSASTGAKEMTKAWTPFSTSGAIRSSPVVDKDGNVYISSFNSFLYKVDARSGKMLWKFETESAIFSTPAIDEDGNVIFGSQDMNVYKVNGTDGKKIWNFLTEGNVGSSPAIDSDGNVIVGSEDTKVYKINGTDGAELWAFETLHQVVSSPVIDEDGNVLVGSYDFNLYKLSGNNGSKIQAFQTESHVYSSPVLDKDGDIFIGSFDKKLYKISGSNWTTLWEVTTGGRIHSSPTVNHDGNVVVGSDDGKLYAFYGNDGKEKWIFETGDLIYSSPAIDKDGNIFVGSDDNKLYKIDGNDGKKIWDFETFDDVVSSPAIDVNGNVYIGSDDGSLYKFHPSCDDEYFFDPVSSNCKPQQRILVAIDRSYQTRAKQYVSEGISFVQDLVSNLDFPEKSIGVLNLIHYSESWLVKFNDKAASDESLLLETLKSTKTKVVFGGTIFSPLLDKYADTVARSESKSWLVLVSDGQGSENYRTLASKKNAMKRRLGNSAPGILYFRTRVHSYGNRILRSICDRIFDHKSRISDLSSLFS